MIFAIKRKIKVKPKINEERIYTKFAWFPLVHKNTIYWMETVVITEKCSKRRIVTPEGRVHHYLGWMRIGITSVEN